MATPRPPRRSTGPQRKKPRVAGRPAPRAGDAAAQPDTPPAAPGTQAAAPDARPQVPESQPTAPNSQPTAPSPGVTTEAEPTPSPPATDATNADATNADAGTDVPSPVTDQPAPDTAAGEPAAVAEDPVREAGPRGKSRRPAARVATIKPQPTRPVTNSPEAQNTEAQNTAAQATAEPNTFDKARGRRRRRPGWRAVGVIAGVAVVVGIVAAVAAVRPGVSLSNNVAYVDSALTSEVSGQAKARVCSVFAVNYGKLDEWQRVAQGNVTGQAAQNFAQYATAVRDALQQSGQTSGGVDCRVDTAGVRSIQGDDADVLVNLIFSQTQDQQAAGSGTKRYDVAMHKVNGQWLISDFTDF